MNLFFRLLLLVILASSLEANFFSDLFKSITNQNRASEDVRVREEPSNDDYIGDEQEKVFSDESDDFNDEEIHSKEKRIFLSFTHYPKRVYLNQHFKVTIKAIVVDKSLVSMATLFVNGKDFKILNPRSKWKRFDDSSYINSFYFKLTSKKSQLPKIRVIYDNAKKKRYKQDITPNPIKLIKLKQSPIFSGVMAKNLDVITHKEKRYDDNSTLVLVDINATMSNLEDFHLDSSIREALDSFEEHLEWQKMYYVAVVPKYQKEFKFTYFDLKTNHFNKVSFPIVLADATLSTQLGLNPKKSKFFLYKLIALFSISLIFLLLYLRYKNGFFLVLSLAVALYTLYTKLLGGSVTLPKGLNIRILPTYNSTIFFKTPNKIEAKVMLKKDGYTKLLLPNGKIGWVKDEDLEKN